MRTQALRRFAHQVRWRGSAELALRSALHRGGLRFRKDLHIKLGAFAARPDIVFTKRRVAVFVDGCFWHCCPEHGTRPKSNTEYWLPKLEANVARDRRNDTALESEGWTVVRIWEHEDVATAADRVRAALEPRAG